MRGKLIKKKRNKWGPGDRLGEEGLPLEAVELDQEEHDHRDQPEYL